MIHYNLKRRLLTARREEFEDYVKAIRGLFWQRQGIFLAVFALTVLYLDAKIAVLCYLSVIATEFFDHRIALHVGSWRTGAQPDFRRAFWFIMASTTLSALAISNFVLNFALLQEDIGHFPPLFFLFAAALFAAMNNHQIFAALIVREIIYGISFVAVAMIDVIRYVPPINDPIWLNFFTVMFVMYFILDISRVFLGMYHKNLQNLRQIQYENKKTKEAYKVKSRFVSTVSHELRTPLTSIKGSLDLINSGAMGEVPEACQNLLQIAGRNSARLEELINDVLDVQKMETNIDCEEFVKVPMEALLQEVVEINQAFAAKHDVALYLGGAQHDVSVLGLERRLIQVLTNLISNAVKFSNPGGRVDVWAEVADGRVRVCVEDHGIGIPENSKEKVFGHFTQVDSSDQREIGGSGLGMSISKQIVERHGGVIDYISQLGDGTIFYVEFDIYDSKSPHRKWIQPQRDAAIVAAVAE
ncbi:HAMP domain-containing sensor histidine kinase [Alisedimentitalea sp. MJ-SS2]|uniref:sensor histidine kinase n=1 Tax=Aliisedimentitalea sp. MJ-SS2 TaxID=3049795 RepID=UPI002909C9E3|nr:HAMP domain-containing sensor histidine kinase [Alisedimentitalea sp. MJ-SS2]MDU8926864.1 HAMP domain-containing sensor histidine kinase [Alisedimentitalea sp. MJ-SS2]